MAFEGDWLAETFVVGFDIGGVAAAEKLVSCLFQGSRGAVVRLVAPDERGQEPDKKDH